MTKTNFLVGMGIGVAVGSLAGMTVSGAKKPPKNIVGKTLKTMGEVVTRCQAPSACNYFGLYGRK